MAYSVESLENGIQKCKKNIEIFEEAIEKERATMKQFRSMIDQMEEVETKKKELLKNIEIEIEGKK